MQKKKGDELSKGDNSYPKLNRLIKWEREVKTGYEWIWMRL